MIGTKADEGLNGLLVNVAGGDGALEGGCEGGLTGNGCITGNVVGSSGTGAAYGKGGLNEGSSCMTADNGVSSCGSRFSALTTRCSSSSEAHRFREWSDDAGKGDT